MVAVRLADLVSPARNGRPLDEGGRGRLLWPAGKRADASDCARRACLHSVAWHRSRG